MGWVFGVGLDFCNRGVGLDAQVWVFGQQALVYPRYKPVRPDCPCAVGDYPVAVVGVDMISLFQLAPASYTLSIEAKTYLAPLNPRKHINPLHKPRHLPPRLLHSPGRLLPRPPHLIRKYINRLHPPNLRPRLHLIPRGLSDLTQNPQVPPPELNKLRSTRSAKPSLVTRVLSVRGAFNLPTVSARGARTQGSRVEDQDPLLRWCGWVGLVVEEGVRDAACCCPRSDD